MSHLRWISPDGSHSAWKIGPGGGRVRYDGHEAFHADFVLAACGDEVGDDWVFDRASGTFSPPPRPPAPEPAELVTGIKLEARRRILAVYPDWQQANMTARAAELLRLRLDTGAWSPAAQAEADALQSAWTWIKQVRAVSDAIEADVPGMTVEQRRDFDIAGDPRWPTPAT